jgi:hypothetical protein
MTKDEIIRMARKAGGADISSNGWTSWVGTQSTEFLERFANLVAEHEREACAKVCEERGMVKGGEVFASRIRARGTT